MVAPRIVGVVVEVLWGCSGAGMVTAGMYVMAGVVIDGNTVPNVLLGWLWKRQEKVARWAARRGRAKFKRRLENA